MLLAKGAKTPKTAFNPTVADCRRRAPLAPRLAQQMYCNTYFCFLQAIKHVFLIFTAFGSEKPSRARRFWYIYLQNTDVKHPRPSIANRPKFSDCPQFNGFCAINARFWVKILQNTQFLWAFAFFLYIVLHFFLNYVRIYTNKGEIYGSL